MDHNQKMKINLYLGDIYSLLDKPTIYQLERVVPSGFLALIYSFLSKIAIMAHKKWCHLTESHKRTKFGFFM